jgi:hypothetical protein
MCIHSFLPETAQVVQQNQRFTGNRQMRPGRGDKKTPHWAALRLFARILLQSAHAYSKLAA